MTPRSLILSAALTVALFSMGQVESEPTYHFEERPGYAPGPVHIAQINESVRAFALRLQKLGGISARFIHHDIAYPNGRDEFDRMGGYALLLITAISQDSLELPLKRVYVQTVRMEQDRMEKRRNPADRHQQIQIGHVLNDEGMEEDEVLRLFISAFGSTNSLWPANQLSADLLDSIRPNHQLRPNPTSNPL